MAKIILYFFCAVSLLSCDGSGSNNHKTVWIGGEIVNPKSDYVVLYKDDCIIDTVHLDSKNFFLYKGDDLGEGLYSFQHNEFQLFYIEPGDSIMLRVNTVDFDESLSYTGIGANKNNFLMELFLLNENENKLMPLWYSIPPVNFEKKIDSLKEIRTSLYREFDSRYHPSKGLKKIVTANIDFDYFSKKEMYTTANLSNIEKQNIDQFPADFYSYRTKIDLGCEDLKSYYPYYRFVNRYFDNLAYQQYKTDHYINKNSFEHTKSKLEVIDSLVSNISFKNNLLKSTALRYLINAKDDNNVHDIVDLFLKLNNNVTHHKEIEKLAEASINLTPGNKIPDVLLVSSDNIARTLQSCIKNPTVLYFWSSESIKHYKDIHAKVAELKSKYPEYDFIGINTDSHFKKWRSIVKKSGYDQKFEFQLENIDEAERELVINSMNKAIILNNKGVILEGNTNLFGSSLEELLVGYLN